MESVLEWKSIVDSEAVGGATGEASVVLVEAYKQNLFLLLCFHFYWSLIL